MFPPSSTFSKPRDPDVPIRGTDNDASLARLSAVQRGYLSDPFVRYFVSRAHLQPPRPPLINIGTYVRSESIDRLVDAWLSMCEGYGERKCQIVSLGAGSDTRFWRLATGEHSKTIAKYIEVDFQEVTTKKAMTIKKNKELLAALGDPSAVSLDGGTSLRSPVYNLLAADLRQLPQSTLGPLLTISTPSALTSTPTSASGSETPPLLDPTTPTLLLFECVLAYMEPRESDAIIAWFADYFRHGKTPKSSSESASAPLGAVVYEMFGLEDAFGRVMKNNLQARSVTLPGCTPYPTLVSLPTRFTRHNFKLSKALTLKEIKYARIPADEIQRISQIEMLDEVEELDLVLDHYAITWGAIWSDDDGDAPSKWGSWDLKWDDAGVGATSGD